jgi:hypothetical protein
MHRKEFWFFVATTVLLGSPLPATARSVAAYGWEAGASKQVAYIATDGDIHELYVQVGGAWAEADLTQRARDAGYPAPQPRPGSPLAGYSWEQAYTKQVAYIAADGHIHELYVQVGGGWAEADLTALGLGPNVADGSPLAGYSSDIYGAGPKQVAYIATDGHIHQLQTDSGSWQDVDLTKLSTVDPSSPPPAPVVGSPLVGYGFPTFDSFSSRHVWYVGDNGHLIELSQVIGGRPWSFNDRGIFCFPLWSCPRSPLVGYNFDEGSSQQVAFFSALSFGHVYELYAGGGSLDDWRDADLTTKVFGPFPPDGSRPNPGAPIVGYGGGWAAWTHINSKQVDYIGVNGHVYELYVDLGSDWTYADLNFLVTDAPIPDGTVLAGYYWQAGDTKQVVYTTADGHIHELYRVTGNPWAHLDLTDRTGATPVL